MQSLAVKYRPKTFDDVTEQDDVKIILQNQLKNNDIRNAYLFVGSAGTGKTTCARIFANAINKGCGTPIEIDGASNNGVDNAREIGEQARSQSIGSEYKIFIIDECQMITVQGWNAMLKLIEEPPLKTIFIFCTTNPEKIPATILSRVQRYDFKKISNQGIVTQLAHILTEENFSGFDVAALEYIAKIADGGMRDAITLLDKCLALSPTLTMDSVNDTLGLAHENALYNVVLSIATYNDLEMLNTIESAEKGGLDLKRFVDQLIEYLLNYAKWKLTGDMSLCSCPDYFKKSFEELGLSSDVLIHILRAIIDISNSIKYSNNPKVIIESMLLLESDTVRHLITD